MKIFGEVADIKTADTLDLKRPDAVFETIVAEPTEMQKDLVQQLSDRATAIHQKKVKPDVDNFLKITTDGRKVGLDQRLISPHFPDEPQSKVNLCMENVFSIWEETAANRSTQLVFCDASTPKSNIWSPFSLSEAQEEKIREMEAAETREGLSDEEKKKLKAKHTPMKNKIKKQHRDKIRKIKADMSEEEIKAFEADHIMETAKAYSEGRYPGQFNLYDDSHFFYYPSSSGDLPVFACCLKSLRRSFWRSAFSSYLRRYSGSDAMRSLCRFLAASLVRFR